jgi:hypothetical protein
MFKSFGFSPLKLKSAGKSEGNQRIFPADSSFRDENKKDLHMQGLICNQKRYRD